MSATKRRPLQGPLMEYLLKHVGETLFLADIAADLDRPPDSVAGGIHKPAKPQGQ